MERSLLWGALAVGGAGWLCTLLLARPSGESAAKAGLTRFQLSAAIALILIGHLLTMPSSPPFARGHGWGMGFLIGGAAALLAAWAVYRLAATAGPVAGASAVSAPFFLALPAAVIPLLFMRTTVIDTLLGVAIGWVAVTILLASLADSDPEAPSSLSPGAAFAAALCGAMTLAVFRGAGAYQEFRWGAAAAVLASGVPLLLFLGALPDVLYSAAALRLPLSGLVARASGSVLPTEEAREAMARGIRLILGGLLMVGLAFLVSRKVVEQPAIVTVTAIGIIAALAAWWLLRDPSEGESPAPNVALAVLVLLAGIMTSYQMLAGFGVAVAVISGWLVGGIAFSGRRAAGVGDSPAGALLAQTLCFGTAFVIYRVAVERFRDELRGVPLVDHYALFGFVFGLLIPGLIARFQTAGEDSAGWRPLIRVVVAGLLLLAAPAAIILVWGQKTLVTFLFGLALAATPAFGRSGVQAFRYSGVQALFAIGMGLAVAQWTHLAMPLAALPRLDKLRILAWLVGIVVVLLISSDLFSRFRSRGETARDSA